MARTDIDWEAIEREFKAGQLSIKEIARQHKLDDKTIRNRAAREGWKRDLTDRVREEMRRQLIREESLRTTHEDNEEDDEIVKSAATRAVQLVTLHRGDAKRQREILADLTIRLRELVPQTGAEQYFNLKDVAAAVKIARDASAAQKNLVAIERQAFNIDGRPDGEEEVKRIIVISKRGTDPDGDGTED